MVPHDQQFEVSSPGMINDDLDSVLAIQNFGVEPGFLTGPHGSKARAPQQQLG